MRSEQDIFSLVLGFANRDENIRAVVINGSRANPVVRPASLGYTPRVVCPAHRFCPAAVPVELRFHRLRLHSQRTRG